MTALDDRPADASSVTPDQAAAFDRIDAAIEGLYALRGLVANRPDVASAVTPRGYDINVYVGHHVGEDEDVPERIASLATDADLHGGIVTQRHGGEYAGIQALFGPFPLHVYALANQVGTITTHTVEATDWQPHPALAAIPKGADR